MHNSIVLFLIIVKIHIGSKIYNSFFSNNTTLTKDDAGKMPNSQKKPKKDVFNILDICNSPPHNFTNITVYHVSSLERNKLQRKPTFNTFLDIFHIEYRNSRFSSFHCSLFVNVVLILTLSLLSWTTTTLDNNVWLQIFLSQNWVITI